MNKMYLKKMCIRCFGSVLIGCSVFVCCTAIGCGKSQAEDMSKDRLEGNCQEILTQVYEKAQFEEEFRSSMEYFQMTPVDESMEEYILGTDDVDYIDSVYSAPLMTSIPYQCVLLRLEEAEDVNEAKQELIENADPIKWVCVEAESVIVENIGDVILYVMADEENANAIRDAFLQMNE